LKFSYLILFWLIIKPLSYLPFFLLYRLSDALYFVLFYVVKYRKSVVYSNLTKAFPKKEKTEIEKIAKESYRNFCDIIVESLKLFSISKTEFIKRIHLEDDSKADTYYDKQQPVMAVTGHFGNWEYGVIMCHYLKHQVIALYKPLKNKFLDKQVKHSRSKFGLILWSNKETEALLQTKFERASMYTYIGDQSPSNPLKAYWTNFLGIETAFYRGAAKAAIKYNYPVIIFHIKRIKRGYYKLKAKMLIEHPLNYSEDEICEKIAKAYENKILEDPADWLWTHKRWKHKKPASLITKNEQLNAGF